MDNWIKVSSYKDIPQGEWMVAINDVLRDKIKIESCEVFNNICVIGGHFAWDMSRVFAYCPQIEKPMCYEYTYSEIYEILLKYIEKSEDKKINIYTILSQLYKDKRIDFPLQEDILSIIDDINSKKDSLISFDIDKSMLRFIFIDSKRVFSSKDKKDGL